MKKYFNDYIYDDLVQLYMLLLCIQFISFITSLFAGFIFWAFINLLFIFFHIYCINKACNDVDEEAKMYKRISELYNEHIH